MGASDWAVVGEATDGPFAVGTAIALECLDLVGQSLEVCDGANEDFELELFFSRRRDSLFLSF